MRLNWSYIFIFTGTTMTVTTQMPDNTLEATGNYKCEKDTSLTLNDTTTNHPISMKTQKLQYQAFHTGNFTGFDGSMYCFLTFTKCRKIYVLVINFQRSMVTIFILSVSYCFWNYVCTYIAITVISQKWLARIFPAQNRK